MTDTLLKPCPFCHGEHIADRDVRDGKQMFCVKCGASVRPNFHGPNNDTLERAIAAWNTRAALSTDAQPAPPDDALAREIDSVIDDFLDCFAEYGDHDRSAMEMVLSEAITRERAKVDALVEALRECNDKLWILRCNSKDDLDRAAAETAGAMANKALANFNKEQTDEA